MTFIHIIPDLRTVYTCTFIDLLYLTIQNTEFGKRSLKYKAAKFYNNLPEEIRFNLGDSVRYNKSVLRNYLLNTEQ